MGGENLAVCMGDALFGIFFSNSQCCGRLKLQNRWYWLHSLSDDACPLLLAEAAYGEQEEQCYVPDNTTCRTIPRPIPSGVAALNSNMKIVARTLGTVEWAKVTPKHKASALNTKITMDALCNNNP